MNEIPQIIWLQWHGNSEPTDDEPSEPVYEVTWCPDKIFQHDVAYVNQEIYQRLWKLAERVWTAALPVKGYPNAQMVSKRLLEELRVELFDAPEG